MSRSERDAENHADGRPPGGPGRRADVRRRQDSIIRARPRASRAQRLLLSLIFALIGSAILMSSRWVVASVDFRSGELAPVTVRVPLFLGRAVDDLQRSGGGIAAARGHEVDDLGPVARARALQPPGWAAWLTYLAALFLVGVLYTEQMRRSHKGRLLRTQAALLGLQLGLAVAMNAVLLMTPIPAVALPAAVLVVMTAVAIDLGTALATALVAALLLGGLTPFDPGVMTVLAVQGACAALFLGDRPRRVTRLRLLAAGTVGGGAAALTYCLIYSLSWNHAPLAELSAPLRSAWVAAGAAGVVAALGAMACLAPFQRLVGDIPLGALIELEDLSHPLLVQIAEGSPGTWQHSLAMANMAQIAANAIGADGRLVRVGAYYHDLGKSIQPKYFIENLSGGEPSPHDALPPQASCDRIFGHVTEGVRVARRHGLHERVVDFMHMHHGDGLLEYFWVKCKEQGNPDRLSEADFRYPGVRPDSKETAILAICDAVEAASRTLRRPDVAAIEGLVQRIVYGKLHLGQLDDSGLTVADLRVISSSLVDTIKHAHHGRIEYQWQRQERQERDEAGAAGPTPTPAGIAAPGRRLVAAEAEVDGDSPTQRLLREPRLDSLDAPRPAWRLRGPARTGGPAGPGGTIENAATEPMTSSDVATLSPALVRPPTAAEVARVTAEMMAAPSAEASAAESAQDAAEGAPVRGATDAAKDAATDAAKDAATDAAQDAANPPLASRAASAVPRADGTPTPRVGSPTADASATLDWTGEAPGDEGPDAANPGTAGRARPE
ncbi:MAG TPA: HDIG domain-containing protein [Kofleriaceae bacterium]|nr:HDIG domain-containing protein [Kofleriaceae bacterium]